MPLSLSNPTQNIASLCQILPNYPTSKSKLLSILAADIVVAIADKANKQALSGKPCLDFGEEVKGSLSSFFRTLA